MVNENPKKRTGRVKVYNIAETTTTFPKSRKLIKEYKFTIYANGRIVKREIKSSDSDSGKKC